MGGCINVLKVERDHDKRNGDALQSNAEGLTSYAAGLPLRGLHTRAVKSARIHVTHVHVAQYNGTDVGKTRPCNGQQVTPMATYGSLC